MARDGFVLGRSDPLARVSALAWRFFFLESVRDVRCVFGKAVGDVVIIVVIDTHCFGVEFCGVKLVVSRSRLTLCFSFERRADRK